MRQFNGNRWLDWARQLQAISQTGLTYARDPFDVQRYERTRQIAAEMMAEGSGSSPLLFEDDFKREAGYATPKVDVRAAAFDSSGRLLLVRELEDGLWTLPGGWADVGDPPSHAAIRETKEESGYDISITKLAAVYDRNLHGHTPIPFHVYKLFFIGIVTGGEARQSSETDGVGFFSEDAIPPLSISRVNPSQITHLFEHRRKPDLPTSFD
jgi:ADP-ribose pyrophosphatase YjhB (NUDIX family)